MPSIISFLTLYFLRVGGVLSPCVVLNASIEGAHVLSLTEIITPNITCASMLFGKQVTVLRSFQDLCGIVI